MNLWPSHMTYDLSHVSSSTPEPLIQNDFQCFVFSPEECGRNQYQHFRPVPPQLDSVRAGGPVPADERERGPGAQVRRDGRGGLVPAGGAAAAEEVSAQRRGHDARKHQTGIPPSVVCTRVWSRSIFIR